MRDETFLIAIEQGGLEFLQVCKHIKYIVFIELEKCSDALKFLGDITLPVREPKNPKPLSTVSLKK